jgi:RimJ/RimL family protein N-acetyltransferase
MQDSILTAREMLATDISPIADYWLHSSSDHLLKMGADIAKLPSRKNFIKMLEEQYQKPLEQKRSYCIIWLQNDKPVGHCNTNPTVFGEEAYMHLHLWPSDLRKKGLGEEFLQLTIPLFFKNLQIKRLISEPYALNEAANRVLQKAGFELEKEYITTPGSLNFEQPVKRWILTAEKFNPR